MFHSKNLSLINKMSIALVVLGVFAFGYGYLVYDRYDWIAVVEPIDVTSKGLYEFAFNSQKDSIYELHLKTERNLHFQAQNCRLGIEKFKNFECGIDEEKLLITWSVFQDDLEIAEGKSNEASDGVWGQNIGKKLHRFKTEKGGSYFITASITETDKILAVTNPSLVVSIEAMEHKEAYVSSSFAYLASFILLGLAFLIWLLTLIHRQWLKSAET